MKRSEIELRCVKILSAQPELISNPLVVEMRDYLITLLEKCERRYEDNDKFEGNWRDFVLLFNQITGRQVKTKTANVKAKKQLSKLLEIYTLEEIGVAINTCWDAARGNQWAAGITPEYITRPEKFDMWYNQSQKKKVVTNNQVYNPNAKYYEKK